MLKPVKFNSQRGDTIIEVLICLAILGLVLGSSYSLANRSLQQTLLAREHTEVIKILSGQIERFKADAADRQNTTKYCYNPGPFDNSDPSKCLFNNLYRVSIKWTPGDATAIPPAPEVYTFQAQWDSLGSDSSTQQEQIFYRP